MKINPVLNKNFYKNISLSSDPLKIFEKFLEVIKTKSLYLLGAGASYRYIKTNYQVYDSVDKILGYSIDELPVIKLKKKEEKDVSRYKILGSPHTILEDDKGNLYFDNLNATVSDYIKHSYPMLLEIAAALSYTLPNNIKNCPEYKIFNLSNRESLFVSLNHDGLINKHLHVRKSNIINLHGYLSEIERYILTSNLLDIIFYEIRPSFLDNLWLATKECDSQLLKQEEYRKFKTKLENNLYKYIIIIGYSFFFQFNQIQDITTYYHIIDYVHKHNSQVIIIDPEPEKISDLLLQCSTKISIFPCKVSWDAFCRAFISTVVEKGVIKSTVTHANIKYFLNAYYYYMNEYEDGNCQEENRIYIPNMNSKSYSK